MAENQATIDHFVKRAEKDLQHLKNEAVRIGGAELSELAHLIDMVLLEVRRQRRKD